MNQNLSPIDTDQLSQFSPLSALPGRILEYVAQQSHIENLTSGSIIQTQGELDDHVSYLLQGDVETRNDESGPHLLTADTPDSQSPLSTQQPFEQTAKAMSDVTLLKLPRELYDSISRLPSRISDDKGWTTERIGSDIKETEIYWEFYETLKKGKIELPSLPDIATRIAKVINNPDTDSDDIARIIQADPSVAARLMSVVNSPVYRGRAEITNLQNAVTRLGRNVIHNLVISFTLGSLFRSRSKTLQKRMVVQWKHTCHVAAISHELGRVTPGKSADHALLCGLVHNIGALPIISAASRHNEIAENPELLEKIIQNLKNDIGAMVLKKWAFGADFINVALHSEDWMHDSIDEPTYLDLVLVAQLHAYIGTARMHQLPRLDLVPAFHKLALGKLTPRHSIGILENAKESIRELRTLLSES